MNENEQLGLLDILSIINFVLNFTGVSNDTIMRELREQDTKYLQEINRKLDTLLERSEENAQLFNGKDYKGRQTRRNGDIS